MGVLAELGRLAIASWSPGGVGGGYIAAGTYAGAADTSLNGSSSLELIAVDIFRAKLSIITDVRLHDKFNSIDWSIPSRSNPAGLIAGGLNDGTVRIWDAAKLIRTRSSEDQTSFVTFDATADARKHSGPIRGLGFNPFVPTRLASGSSDGTVLIWDLSNPAAGASVRHPAGQAPSGTSALKEQVTAISWNRKVQHILASSTSSGVMNVWDLNQSRQVISIRNPRGRLRCSSLAWHPEIATQIVMTCDQDDSTGALLWDLRNASQPIMSYTHHARGVASSSWCSHDSDLLLTSSQDSRTVVVSVSTGELVSEAPQTANWNFDVKWSSRIPGLYLSSSFDGRLTVNSMMTSTTAPAVSSETASALAESFGEAAGGFQTSAPEKSPRASESQRVSYSFTKPPKWFKRPVSISLAFGGSRVSVCTKDKKSKVIVESYEETLPIPKEACEQLDAVLMDLTCDNPAPAQTCCDKASTAAETPKDKMAWDALSIMFQTDSRRKLLSYLGFELPPKDAGDDITSHVYGLMQSPALAVPVRPEGAEEVEYSEQKENPSEEVEPVTNGTSQMNLSGPAPWEVSAAPANELDVNQSILDGDDIANGTGDGASSKPNGVVSGKDDAGDATSFSGKSREQMDSMIKRAVIVGDFKTAVDACLHVERTADALVIAHAGGPVLWLRTQAEYLSRASLSSGSKIVGAIAGSKSKLDEYIREAGEQGKEAWKEAIAVLLTYSSPEELPEACTALGQRLLMKDDHSSALFCFICGGNTRMATVAWMRDRPSSSKSISLMMVDRIKQLTFLVQKVRLLTASVVLAQGEREIGSVRALDEVSGAVLCEYGALLATQGNYASAITYLSNLDPSYSCPYGTAEDLQAKASDCLTMEDSATMDQAAGSYPQSYVDQSTPYMSEYGANNPYAQPSGPYGAVQPPTMASTWNSQPPPPPAMPLAPAPYIGSGMNEMSYSSPAPPIPVPAMASASPTQSAYSTHRSTTERSSFDPASAYGSAPAYNPNSYHAVSPRMQSAPGPDLRQHIPSPPGHHGGALASVPPVPLPPAGRQPVPPQPHEAYRPPPVTGMHMGGNQGMTPTDALPPPPPPPPTIDAPPPVPYHSRARAGQGQNLPPSAEVAVAETRRSKPLSSSGTPAGPPKRSGSTSSSLSALGIGIVLLEKADISKIPPTQQVIVNSLRGSYNYARGLSEDPRYRKKMDDVSKRLGKLLAALNNGLVDGPTVELLISFSKAVEKGNYSAASAVESTLRKKHWDTNSQWIQGLRRLITCVTTGR